MTRCKAMAGALLAAGALGACASNSGVETTPTFAAARYLPPSPKAPAKGRAATPPVGADVGAVAVARANRSAVRRPDGASMRGATWVVDAHDTNRPYEFPLAPDNVLTVLLPPGERFNGAVGGRTDDFLVTTTYAGPRPAISILPRSSGAKGNIQVATTGGFYMFNPIVTRRTALALVDIGAEDRGAARPAAAVPQPEGDFTPLRLVNPKGGALPAWAPPEAWADGRKLVVRLDAPVPELPALFAGQRGEQTVSYRAVADGAGSLYLVTSRRVTEAELRLDGEAVRVTVDPQAVGAGMAARPGTGWRDATTLPAQGPGSNVAVFVWPGLGDGGLALDPGAPPRSSFTFDPAPPPEAADDLTRL